jgi:transposase, IS5 family
MKQASLSMTGFFDKGKKTRREQFLAEMEQVLPWAQLYALIEPRYPKGSRAGGRPPLPLERLFRIYCLQQWYNLSDPGAEDALYDSIALRRFAGVCTDADVIPDETSILNFRRLLEAHDLSAKLLVRINTYLSDQGLFLGKGTMWMRPSSTPRPRPRMRRNNATRRCIRPEKANSGISA